jgi:hypothetical protein
MSLEFKGGLRVVFTGRAGGVVSYDGSSWLRTMIHDKPRLIGPGYLLGTASGFFPVQVVNQCMTEVASDVVNRFSPKESVRVMPFYCGRQLRRSRSETVPAASPSRRRAQTWCDLFVAPCALNVFPREGVCLGALGRPGVISYASGFFEPAPRICRHLLATKDDSDRLLADDLTEDFWISARRASRRVCAPVK